MKLIIAQTIEKMAEKIGLDFDDVYNFIRYNWSSGFIQLCSPMEGTIAYKGYIDNLKRIIIFAVNKNGIIYPVYIGDKHDQIAKNITVDIVRKNSNNWHKNIEKDINNGKIKIRHF